MDWKPRVIVIGPGGVKGLMILGFLSPIEQSGLLHKVDTYCGVSIGAIISLLMIVGYKIREIIGVASKIDIFKDVSLLDVNAMINNKGLMSNEPARLKLIELVLNKLGNIPTLYELYMQTGKSLITTTLNATDEITEYMGPFTHGKTSCIDAVMYSMNIPFIYYQLIDGRGKTYVDGALANPYPIDYFDNNHENILGIYIKTIYNDNYDGLTTSSYAYKLLESTINQRRASIINKSSSKCLHGVLETLHKDIMGINLSIKDKAEMLTDGYNAGKLFLDQLSQPHDAPKEVLYQYPEYYMNQ